MAYGSSSLPKTVRAQRDPYDPDKQYLVSIHPHGVICCGWFNLLSRNCREDEERGTRYFRNRLDLMDGIDLTLCFAPCVQYAPLHGRRALHQVVRGYPFCLALAAFPSGICRGKAVKNFSRGEDFPCGTGDILAPRQESNEWPPEG